MAVKHFVVTAALALALACSQPDRSARDQYENGQNKLQAALSKATDPILQVGESQGQARLRRSEDGPHDDVVFDNEKEADESDAWRTKRGYALWTQRPSNVQAHESFASYQPAKYQLSRPYYIPVYGASGRVPIFLPPQTLNYNPGFPIDNPLPKRPFRGPPYLPPSTDKPTENPMVTVKERFGDDDDDDDRPIWGTKAPAKPQLRPGGAIPTRPPPPPSSAFPPLVHDATGRINKLSADEDDGLVSSAFGPPQNIQQGRQPPPKQVGPSNCVWAIVSCCSASSTSVPDSCFEQRGCPGPFWGPLPCESDFAKAAIASALNYYRP